jgi:hypothetical protein
VSYVIVIELHKRRLFIYIPYAKDQIWTFNLVYIYADWSLCYLTYNVFSFYGLGVLCYYLQRLSSLLLESGSLIYKSIGVQRILDVFRTHVAGKIPTSVMCSSGSLGLEEETAGRCHMPICPYANMSLS